MAVGKYSPTVVAAYAADQHWWVRHQGRDEFFDADGYDRYGYDENDIDRAGNHEDAYADEVMFFDGACIHYLYQETQQEWDFDGTAPIKKGAI